MPSIPVIVGVAVVIVLIAVGWVWDHKWRPLQTKRGIPCPSFSKNLSLIGQAIVSDTGDKSKKGAAAFDWRIVHVVDAVIIGVTAYLWISGTVDISWKLGTALILAPLFLSSGRISSVKKKTLKQTQEVFNVANPKLSYLRADRTASLHPWDFVKVTKLTDEGDVAEVSLVLPATFSVSSVEARALFEREFSALMSAASESDWKFEWKPERRQLIARRVPPLPTSVEYPGSADKPWNVIPLGVSNNGEESWNLNDQAQGIILGLTGSGKSVTQRSVLYHAFQHPKEIRMYAIDLKRVELTMWENYPGMIQIASDLDAALDVITNAREAMMERFDRMKEAKVQFIDDIPGSHEPAILIMFDESAEALIPGTGNSPEVKEENGTKGAITDAVRSIARLGRAAKVHIILCTQRAEVAAIGGGDAKNNYGFRILLGHGDKTASMMALDTMSGTEIEPNIKGRGIISRNGAETKFQSYWTPKDWPAKHGIFPIGSPEAHAAESGARGVVNNVIVDDIDDDDYVDGESIATEMESKPEAEPAFGNIVEDTDDGVVEVADDGDGFDDDEGFGGFDDDLDFDAVWK